MRMRAVKACRWEGKQLLVLGRHAGVPNVAHWLALLLVALCSEAMAQQPHEHGAIPPMAGPSKAGSSMAGSPMPGSTVGAVSSPGRIAANRAEYQAPSTRKMASLLRATFEATDWKLDPNKPEQRVRYYQSMLDQRKLAWSDDAVVRLQLAEELLSAGQSEAAVNTLESLKAELRAAGKTLPATAEQQIEEWLAISYLRLGEQENCAHMHGQRACIFPIRASATHQLPRGAEGAVRELTTMLKTDPANAEAMWLLNVAYMQLGRYPKEVPAAVLIPSKLFDSDLAFAEFPDRAGSAGLDITGHAGGAVMEDFDGDGLLDVMVTSSGPLDQMHLFHNNGDGTFSDVTTQAGLLGEVGGLNLVETDYNNDGHPDVLVLRGGWWAKQGCYPMSLLRNNGDGTFDDVTEAAGLISLHPTQTAAWADFDNDGWLDLFVGHESRADDPHPSQLFHNNHDGTFSEMGERSGLANLGFVKGVAWGDFNNDGRPDLYISVMYGRNHLFRNDGAVSGTAAGTGWKFTDVTQEAGVAQQQNSFATWFFDYDNDGWPDIFVAGYSTNSMQDVGAFEMGRPNAAETPRLYRNNHDGTFREVAKQTGLDRAILVMGANFGDLDNDGWLDIYLGTGESSYQALLPNRMFRSDMGKRFLDVTTVGGFGHLQKGHGVAFGDLENSGSEDIFEEMGGALPGDIYQSALYHNPGNANHWITLNLEGATTNRAGFGARIDVTVKSQHGDRHIFRTVGYGSSFGGNPLRQHIGVGPANTVASVEVSWPVSHTVQKFRDVRVNQSYGIREGEQRIEPLRRSTSGNRVGQ